MKKALSLILAWIMTVGIIPTAAIGVFAEETPVEQSSTASSALPADAVQIGTAAELLAITGTESGKYYVLTADIDLGTTTDDTYAVTTYNIAPITLNGSTLDGNGHSITGYALSNANNKNLGLIEVSGTSTIKNVIFGADNAKVTMTISDNWNNFSTVVSSVASGVSLTMQNVTAYVNITSGGTSTADITIGALIGDVAGTAHLTNCVTYGTITETPASLDNNGTRGVGGLVGGLSGGGTLTFTACKNNVNISSTKGERIGGLIGIVKQPGVTITNCTNNGNISGVAGVGGFVGFVENAGAALTISHVTNNGSVTSTVTSGNGGAGGVIGLVTGASSINITKFVNTGSVTAERYAGAVIGHCGGTSASVMVDGAMNIGTVTAKGAKAAVITGYAGVKSISVNGAINMGTISSAWNAVGTFGFSSANTATTVTNCVQAGTFKNADNYYGIWLRENATSNDYGTSNAYLTGKTSDTYNNGATSLADPDAVLTLLNTDVYQSVWGTFKASDVDTNGKATGVVQATPVLYGAQMGGTYVNEEDGKTYTSVRFVGTIKNTLRYSELGLSVTVGEVTIPKISKYVYTTVTATGNGGEQLEYTAESLGGSYIFAHTITDIPTEGELTMTVKPYAIDTDGTEYNDGIAYTVTFSNGVLVSATPVQA